MRCKNISLWAVSLAFTFAACSAQSPTNERGLFSPIDAGMERLIAEAITEAISQNKSEQVFVRVVDSMPSAWLRESWVDPSDDDDGAQSLSRRFPDASREEIEFFCMEFPQQKERFTKFGMPYPKEETAPKLDPVILSSDEYKFIYTIFLRVKMTPHTGRLVFVLIETNAGDGHEHESTYLVRLKFDDEANGVSVTSIEWLTAT